VVVLLSPCQSVPVLASRTRPGWTDSRVVEADPANSGKGLEPTPQGTPFPTRRSSTPTLLPRVFRAACPSTVQGTGHTRAASCPGVARVRGTDGFRPSAGPGCGLCCCTDVLDPDGLSLLDTDGSGERIFRLSPGASLEETGWIRCPVTQAVGPADAPPPSNVRPCRQRAMGAGNPGVTACAAGWSSEPRHHAPPAAHRLPP